MNTTTRTVTCPHCSAKLRTATAPEKKVRCPKCRTPFHPAGDARPAPGNRVACGACKAKLTLKNVKPGAKFKCPKCGSIERVLAPAAETKANSAPKGATVKASPSKPAAKPVPAKKAVPKRVEPKLPPEPAWEPEPVVTAPPRSAPVAPPPSSRAQPRRKAGDDDSGPWVSGKLLTAGIVVLLLGVGVGAWSFFGGESGPQRGEIQGMVTIDGVPVEVGKIHFLPIDPKGPLVAVPDAPIEKGKYKISREQGPSVGMCKVEIRVPKKTGRPKLTIMGGVEDETEEGAAERFNKKSELTFEVKAGPNTKDFEVSAR